MESYVEKLDKIAAEYHNQDLPDKFIEAISQRHTFDWLHSNISQSARVLELGYGDGIVNDELVTSGYNIEVIEGSPAVSAAARSNNPALTIHTELFERFSPAYQYDSIIAFHVLEHIDHPVSLLKRMRYWLNPGGRILILCPNRSSIHRQLAVEMGIQETLDELSPRDKLVGHQRVYSLDTLQSDVEAAGFRVSERKGFFFKPLPNGMMTEFSEELIWAMNRISDDMPAEMLANIGMVISPQEED